MDGERENVLRYDPKMELGLAPLPEWGRGGAFRSVAGVGVGVGPGGMTEGEGLALMVGRDRGLEAVKGGVEGPEWAWRMDRKVRMVQRYGVEMKSLVSSG